ncbi:MAG: ABC transporter substrate-binding protein, partial [Acidimicrobiales bacterium]|nr:ABC transporter substrate-binding protein [Acidimicrobiales bacterium]
SPPCVEFSGDNGGATTRGVTKDRILLTARSTAPLDLGGASGEVQDDQADVERTQRAFVEFFNKKLQLYGRQVEVRFFGGKGDATAETLGGGQEGANADAITVAQEIQAFGEINGGTPPYADALVRQKVMAFGPIHMSREWYDARRPYSWAVLVDCTVLTESTVNYMANRLLGKPAKFAGDAAYKKAERKFGLIVPENPWYQECANRSQAIMRQKGFDFTKRINYPLDINQASQIAANMVAQMKDAGVTTFVCWCDPIVPIFVTTQATQQDYWPEWLVSGTVLTDTDALGQLYDQDQWGHAFGHSFLNDFAGSDNEAYRAYKSVRTDEPANNYRLLYYPILQAFLGLQLAGPKLTPETYEQGMFSYTPSAGESGRWDFGPGDYTATSDAREIYWDPNATSRANGKKGTWVTTLEGRRFKNNWPKGDPAFPATPTNS